MRARMAMAAAAFWVAIAAPAAARAQRAPEGPALPASISVRAERVEYYADIAVIIARGDVRVRQADGSSVEGDAFAMNLGLRRFLVVGHVRLTTSAGTLVGAGYADFMAFQRQYFVPLEPEADRWTFFDYDYAQPEKGREMPGDAFFIPDVAGSRPYIVARSVTVNASTYVRFAPATFELFDGALVTPPLPPYTYNFSANQNFAINGLAGASFEVPYNIVGSPAALGAVHYRYDQTRGWYGSLQQNFAWRDTYAVFSLNPATQESKQWNMLAYRRLSAQSALQLDGQLFTFQSGLSQPLSSSGFADAQYTQGLRSSSLLLDLTQSYASLLARPSLGYYGDPTHPWFPNHPLTAGVLWSGYDERLGQSGLVYRLASGFGFQHDIFGASQTGERNVPSYYLRASLYTPVYRGPFGIGLNGSYSIADTWFSALNVAQTQGLVVSASRRVSSNLVVVGSVAVASSTAQNAKAIVSPNVATGFVPAPASPNGLPPFAGPFLRATNRAYSLSTVWAPSPDFQFSGVAEQQNFSPQQIPLVAGPPRHLLIGDMRARVTRVLFLDVRAAYQFNWGGQPWSPVVFTLTAK